MQHLLSLWQAGRGVQALLALQAILLLLSRVPEGSVETALDDMCAAALAEGPRENGRGRCRRGLAGDSQVGGGVKELLGGQPNDWGRKGVLNSFITEHTAALSATLSKEHAVALISLLEQLIVLLGKMERFLDQGEAMCEMGKHLLFLSRQSEAASWLQRARDVGAAHGFYSVECNSCIGLGRVAMVEGRHGEGLDLLRNAVTCAHLLASHDPNDSKFELEALEAMIRGCFETHAFEEVAPLVLRYREAAEAFTIVAASAIDKSISIYAHLDSLYYCARLQEVLSFFASRWEPHHTMFDSCFQQGCVTSVSGGAREKTHALVEPSFLSRCAEGLKRPQGRCALCSTS